MQEVWLFVGLCFVCGLVWCIAGYYNGYKDALISCGNKFITCQVLLNVSMEQEKQCYEFLHNVSVYEEALNVLGGK